MNESPQPDPVIERLQDVIVGEIEQRDVILVNHDPAWHERFAAEAERIRATVGDRARRIEHIGSTAVPDLASKSIIDILLVVDDPADEAAYVPELLRAGYQLRVREPAFHEHRMLRTAARDVHVHIFGPDAPEVARLLLLRDTLRTDPAARQRYERTNVR